MTSGVYTHTAATGTYTCTYTVYHIYMYIVLVSTFQYYSCQLFFLSYQLKSKLESTLPQHTVRVHERSVIETMGKVKQLRLKTTPLSQEKKKSCLRRDSNPRRSAYQADALPTKPPRQPSWAGRIFKCYAKAKSPLP